MAKKTEEEKEHEIVLRERKRWLQNLIEAVQPFIPLSGESYDFKYQDGQKESVSVINLGIVEGIMLDRCLVYVPYREKSVTSTVEFKIAHLGDNRGHDGVNVERLVNLPDEEWSKFKTQVVSSLTYFKAKIVHELDALINCKVE